MTGRAEATVLIVGAGPTGLALAVWLAREGIAVRIVDKLAEPATTSRAVAIQARTLELYRQLGIAEGLVAEGREATGVNLWVAGKPVAHAVFGALGAGISPYPYAMIVSQNVHEQYLSRSLQDLGVTVERGTELVGLETV